MNLPHAICGSALFVAALISGAQTALATPAHTLEIVDKVPAFEQFYKKATAHPLSPDARWDMWQKDYGIAAVPPGPDGQKMARKLLDGAWDKYPALLPALAVLNKTAHSFAKDDFEKVNALLKTQGTPIKTKLVLYVGQFDDNAYTVPPMGKRAATVVVPVENPDLRVTLAHELTHSVHMQLAHVKNSFGGPLGETVFLEGVAMHASKKIVPGLADEAYTQRKTDGDWLKRCLAKKAAVLSGIRADLNKSGHEIAMKYTFGDGNTGMPREVYCAAWIVVGQMLKTQSLARLARIPESKMPAVIAAAIAKN